MDERCKLTLAILAILIGYVSAMLLFIYSVKSEARRKNKLEQEVRLALSNFKKRIARASSIQTIDTIIKEIADYKSTLNGSTLATDLEFNEAVTMASVVKWRYKNEDQIGTEI